MGSPEALSASLAQHLRYIFDTASSSPAGGGPAWTALLAHYGIAPFAADERAMSVKYMHLTRGALPSEVRIVLEGLRNWATREFQSLDAPNTALQYEIAGLVDREVARYELAIGVFAGPSLGSIFANAQDTSKEVPWANMKYKQVTNLTCVHCGGPQEQPKDFICKFCRRPIAGSIEPNQ